MWFELKKKKDWSLRSQSKKELWTLDWIPNFCNGHEEIKSQKKKHKQNEILQSKN